MKNNAIYLEDLREASEILSSWRQDHASCGVLALVAEKSSGLVGQLQQIVNELDVPLVGGLLPGLISGGGLKDKGVVLLRFDKMPGYLISELAVNEPLLGQDLDKLVAGLDVNDEAGHKTLFMIFDAMLPHVSSVVDGLYLRLGDRVRYGGISAGSETFEPVDCIFDNNSFSGGCVLAILLDARQDVVLAHGYSKPEVSMSATSASGNCISSLDWRPAFDVYRELARSNYGIDVTRDNFYQFAVHFPLGVVRMDGEMLVRIPVGLDESGSIYCVGEVPENSVLTLLQGVAPGAVETAEKIAGRLVESESAVLFYCAGRRMHLGKESEEEMRVFCHNAGERVVVGGLSLGEVGGAEKGGYPLFHNAAIVGLSW